MAEPRDPSDWRGLRDPADRRGRQDDVPEADALDQERDVEGDAVAVFPQDVTFGDAVPEADVIEQALEVGAADDEREWTSGGR